MQTNQHRANPKFPYYRGRPISEWVEALSGGRFRRPVAERPVALVTGGGRGIGRLVAQALAGTGMAVGITARSAGELAETVELVEAGGGVAVAVVADVSDEAAMARAVAQLESQLGPIDVLINNAGIVGPVGPAWEVDPSDWWRTLDINLRGTFVTTALVLPAMVARGSGRIINLSSQAGAYRWPTVSAYSVSKAALVKFTENLAHETERHGVAVFSLDPGLLPIGMAEPAFSGATPPGRNEARVFAWLRREIEEGRGADPDDAVDLIVAVATGCYDDLSGLQLSVHDDLEAVRADIDLIRESDLYVLGRRTVAERKTA
jgi:NAD(P)-dependent dehydrogenase (short-subunit alcohol dehydrogenase family)